MAACGCTYICAMMMVENECGAPIILEQMELESAVLQRAVRVDIYRPEMVLGKDVSLLLLHDGQDLAQTHFAKILTTLTVAGMLRPLVVAAIYAGPERLQEYGTAGVPDFEGRGSMAHLHQQFVVEELLPQLQSKLKVEIFAEQAVGGFSLGGLSAMSLAWNYKDQFKKVGVFSGSLWWRSRALGPGYSDDQHRIMHQSVRRGNYCAGMRFYFTTGSLDETADRNGNGIIDSIDDTLDLIAELEQKGYRQGDDIVYHNYAEGRHDIPTWVRVLPQFLLWGWGKGG